MNDLLILLIVGVPLFVFIVSNVVKYLAIEETGRDRDRAIDDFLSDIGLDSFYIGISVLISTFIAMNNVSSQSLIYLTCYGILSSLVAALYNYPFENRSQNWCFWFGIIISSIPIIYSLLIFINMQ